MKIKQIQKKTQKQSTPLGTPPLNIHLQKQTGMRFGIYLFTTLVLPTERHKR